VLNLEFVLKEQAEQKESERVQTALEEEEWERERALEKNAKSLETLKLSSLVQQLTSKDEEILHLKRKDTCVH